MLPLPDVGLIDVGLIDVSLIEFQTVLRSEIS